MTDQAPRPEGSDSSEELGLEPERDTATSEMSRLLDLSATQAVQINGLMFDALGQPRRRYVRVTLNGNHCVMFPSEGDCYVEDARNAGDPDWERYIVRDVYLSEREFEDLPEHDGF